MFDLERKKNTKQNQLFVATQNCTFNWKRNNVVAFSLLKQQQRV